MTLHKFLVSLLIAGIPSLQARAQTKNDNVFPKLPPTHTDSNSGKATGLPIQSLPVIRQIEIVGGHGGVPNAALAKAAALPSLGQNGNAEIIRKAADAVLAVYRQHGFTVAQVVASEITDAGVLRLTVAEGVIRQIRIKGNRKTRDTTILAALSLHPGDSYQENHVRSDRENLARLNIFDDVSIAPVAPGSDPDSDNQEPDPKRITWATTWRKAIPPKSTNEVGQVDVIVKVLERKTVNIAATLGYGDSNGLIGYFNFSEDNLLGTAQKASIEWQRTTRSHYDDSNGQVVVDSTRHAYNIGYSAPLLAKSRLGYAIQIYDQNTVFLPFFTGTTETIRSYERRRGGTIQVGHLIVSGTSLYLSARRDVVGYDPIPSNLNPPVAALQNASGTIGAIGINLILDGRDYPTDPRHGHYDSFLYERSGRYFGGNRPFGQTTADLRQYIPLTSGKNGITLAMRQLGGTSTGDVPLSEQFWLGGYELLRGYELYSIHGDRLLLSQIEARVPLSAGLQGVLFTDYGNAWEPGQSVSIRSLHADGGAGLRFITPIGPIRLDAAYGSHLQTYISLGQAY